VAAWLYPLGEMVDRDPDPYVTLGVASDVSEAELRSAYRRLAQLHHPDHNGGSAEAARRFEAVQEAYARVRAMRARANGGSSGGWGGGSGGGPSATRAGSMGDPKASPDPDLEARLADLEHQLRSTHAAREAARQARDAARRAAREATQPAESPRPSDEELGYHKTDDSFSKILADATSELSEHLSAARDHPGPKRLSDLIDELGAKLTGEPPSH